MVGIYKPRQIPIPFNYQQHAFSGLMVGFHHDGNSGRYVYPVYEIHVDSSTGIAHKEARCHEDRVY